MNTDLSVVAAFGCALCNAVAAVMQKTSAAKVGDINSYDTRVVLRLFRQVPYVIGLVLDLAAGILTLVAANKLPLFLVQAIVATSVLLTAFLERFFLKRKINWRTYVAALVVVLGLGCLSLAAQPEKTAVVSAAVKHTILLMPVLLILLGAVFIKSSGRLSTWLLAGLSGVAFGGVSVVGRILVYPNPIWLLVKNPLLWSLILYGVLGMYLFTAALQRTLATIVNGVMVATQTIIPLIIGIILLGDTPRNGYWGFVWIGCLVVTVACAYIAVTDKA